MNIKLCKPYITGKELVYMNDIITNGKTIAGDGEYSKRVHALLQRRYGARKALLTTSATAALEFAVRLCNLQAGDEVIVPSFTFSSTINAVLLNTGVRVVFADIDPRTCNVDSQDIARKVTEKTRAIIVVHYAGVACDMDAIMRLARKHKLRVIEDAAQCIGAKYKNKYLGTIGDFGCISFHETKNITCGEGGALFINANSQRIIKQAEIIREKGTNRTKFLAGVVNKYTWVAVGASYLPSDLLAAFLLAQLEAEPKVTQLRRAIYDFYKKELQPFEKLGLATLPYCPKNATHNAHIFFILLPSRVQRNFVMQYLRQRGVGATFHYIPLHSSPMGKKLGYKAADLPITHALGTRLLRLPLYAGMTKAEMQFVVAMTEDALNAWQGLNRKDRHKETAEKRGFKNNQKGMPIAANA